MITLLVTVDDSVYQYVLIKQNQKRNQNKKKELNCGGAGGVKVWVSR
jgi:hypothetical protein